jgi:chemotaxis protein CheD
MLPRPPQNKPESAQKQGKFAETATPYLLEALIHSGASRHRIRAKLAGGARMFKLSSSSKTSFLAIGEQNIKATLSMLEKLSIIVEAQDLGGTQGRSIRFDTETWMLEIKTLGQGIKLI